MNDITNNTLGTPNAITNSLHVLSKSKRANTFAESYYSNIQKIKMKKKTDFFFFKKIRLGSVHGP